MMALACAICGGELRPTAITSEGMSQSCPCGKTQITTLNKGKLDLGDVRTEIDAPEPEFFEQRPWER